MSTRMGIRIGYAVVFGVCVVGIGLVVKQYFFSGTPRVMVEHSLEESGAAGSAIEPAALSDTDAPVAADGRTENGAESASTPTQEAARLETLPAQKNTASQPTGATTDQSVVSGIVSRLVHFGFATTPIRSSKTIDTIVLHSSYNNQGGDPYSVEAVIGIWKRYGVAPHYLIDRKGTIYNLVDPKYSAYHAGVSEMKDGRTNVNDFSIGIEMLNSETDTYTDAEYAVVNRLIASLKKQYPIKYVVGHSDIAPGRKTDPWGFDWKRIH